MHILTCIDIQSHIFGITGNVLPEDVRHFRENGADKIIGKPFKNQDILDALIELGVTSQHPNQCK